MMKGNGFIALLALATNVWGQFNLIDSLSSTLGLNVTQLSTLINQVTGVLDLGTPQELCSGQLIARFNPPLRAQSTTTTRTSSGTLTCAIQTGGEASAAYISRVNITSSCLIAPPGGLVNDLSNGRALASYPSGQASMLTFGTKVGATIGVQYVQVTTASVVAGKFAGRPALTIETGDAISKVAQLTQCITSGISSLPNPLTLIIF